MTDYSKMSDFEINKAVAEQLHKDKPSLIFQRDMPSRPEVTVFCDIGDGEIVSILCADCGKELQAEEVYVCESCDQEQRKFIESVMGGGDEASNSV